MGDGFAALILLGIGFAVYLIPSWIAAARRAKNIAAIVALNFLLGWTLVGWVGALVWALAAERGSAAASGDRIVLRLRMIDGANIRQAPGGIVRLRAATGDAIAVEGEGGVIAHITGEQARTVSFRTETIGKPQARITNWTPEGLIVLVVDFARPAG